MTDEVYVSSAFSALDGSDRVRMRAYGSDGTPWDGLSVLMKSRKGEEIFPNELPASYDGIVKGKAVQPHHGLRWNGGTFLVDGKTSDILRPYFCGNVAFRKTFIHQNDRVTEVDGSYISFAVSNIENLVLLDQCRSVIKDPVLGINTIALPTIEDGDICIKKGKEPEHYIWCDLNLHSALFVRKGMLAAFDEAGLSSQMQFRRCRTADYG